MSSIAPFLIPIVGSVALFTFISIAVWSDNRRREREEYYRHETYRKMLEAPGGNSETVLAFIRAQEASRDRRRLAGLRLGGMVTAMAGLGIMIFLRFLVRDEPVYLAGVIPLLIGAVLAFYGYTAKPDAA